MTREELIGKVTSAMSDEEGFDVTETEAKDRGIPFPTLSQRLANPGNIRRWSHDGVKYPRNATGYVDFVAWAAANKSSNPTADGLAEGWRVLRVLAGQYVDGHYTSSPKPTLIEMFAAYAPAADGNDPGSYTRTVAAKTGLPADVPLASLITE